MTTTPIAVCDDCGHPHDPMKSLCWITCPHCGYVGDIQTFDVLGADDGMLWCNTCNNEVPIDKDQTMSDWIEGPPKEDGLYACAFADGKSSAVLRVEGRIRFYVYHDGSKHNGLGVCQFRVCSHYRLPEPQKPLELWLLNAAKAIRHFVLDGNGVLPFDQWDAAVAKIIEKHKEQEP